MMQKRLKKRDDETAKMIADLQRIKKCNGKVRPADVIRAMMIWDELEKRGIDVDEVLS